MTQRMWKLREAKEWLVSQCLSERRRSPEEPAIRMKFNQPPSDERPPSHLIWEAFQLLENAGILTGHAVTADNTGPVPLMINGMALTPRAIEIQENAEETQASREPAKELIGFE